MIVTTCLQNVSANYWIGKQDSRIATKCLQNVSATYWMGKQNLSNCDYMSAEREHYLLDGEAGFEGL